VNQLRRIPRTDLPRVRDLETGEEREATSAELLNMGILHRVDDVYDVAHVDGTPEPEWGEKLIEGPGRYQRLPPRLAALVAAIRFAGE
jgi:hypothetical protein